MRSIDVSIGIILDLPRVLIARRKANDTLGGYWEFPGGKVEMGETLQSALLRELTEELAITCEILDRLEAFTFSYPGTDIRLHPFTVRIVGGTPQPLQSDEVRWVAVRELAAFRFPAANQPLIDGLQRRFGI